MAAPCCPCLPRPFVLFEFVIHLAKAFALFVTASALAKAFALFVSVTILAKPFELFVSVINLAKLFELFVSVHDVRLHHRTRYNEACPRYVTAAFSDLPQAVRVTLQRYGFHPSRECVLTLHELSELQQLDTLAVEIQSALPTHARNSHDIMAILKSLAALGTFTLPTSVLPEALGYAQQQAGASLSSVEAPLSGTQWKSWTRLAYLHLHA
eukprot:5140684-Amphidinium_carterae.2